VRLPNIIFLESYANHLSFLKSHNYNTQSNGKMRLNILMDHKYLHMKENFYK